MKTRNMNMDFELGVIEAHGLLQISPKNRCDEWERDRLEWLKKWEPAIVPDQPETKGLKFDTYPLV